jgi:competence protein ComEC
LYLAPSLWAADAEFHFIDVGIGDAILLIAPEGHRILIDGGDRKGFAGQETPADIMLAYLARHVPTKTLDLVVLTHSDLDHLGGLVKLFKTANRPGGFQVKEYWDSGYQGSGPCQITQTYRKFLEEIQRLPGLSLRRPITAHLPSPHDTREIGGLTLQVLLADLAPNKGNCAYRVNDSSVVLKVTHGGVRALLAGDIMAKARTAPASEPPKHAEGRLLNREAGSPGLLRADLLKVPHHGSETSSSDAFIDVVAPRTAVVSSAVTSAYQLPDASVIARYTQRGIRVFQTNRGPKEQDFSEPKFGNDHIVCLSTGAPEGLDCKYRKN